ncbi:hypothetical protein ABEB36_007452 [Hypothenemus hampei]|uniref:Uncharacterized protein n=1 Tax=Hypothenemus hampei TaxID=57062 RepID=A0ABD1EUX3_HYPHA
MLHDDSEKKETDNLYYNLGINPEVVNCIRICPISKADCTKANYFLNPHSLRKVDDGAMSMLRHFNYVLLNPPFNISISTECCKATLIILRAKVFSYYYLYPITENKRILISSYPYLVQDESIIHYNPNSCREVKKTYYCRQICYPPDECIESFLIGDSHENCRKIKINVEEPTTQQEQIIKESMLIVLV